MAARVAAAHLAASVISRRLLCALRSREEAFQTAQRVSNSRRPGQIAALVRRFATNA